MPNPERTLPWFRSKVSELLVSGVGVLGSRMPVLVVCGGRARNPQAHTPVA